MSRERVTIRGAAVLAALLAGFAYIGAGCWLPATVQPEPIPCSTDLDCCLKNPRICSETHPDLYRSLYGPSPDTLGEVTP